MDIDGLTLGAIAILAVVVCFLALVIRSFKRDRDTYVTRVGFFIERERFDDEDEEDTAIRHWPEREDSG